MEGSSSENSGIASTKKKRNSAHGLFTALLLAMLLASVLQIVYHHPMLPDIQQHPVLEGNKIGWKVPRASYQEKATSQKEDTEPPEPEDLMALEEDTVEHNPLLKLLEDANLIQSSDVQKHLDALNNPNVNTVDINNITLPTWPVLQSLYGSLQHPVVIGMDTCEAYRAAVLPSERLTAVAGMFNTGTNAMEHHLKHNLKGVQTTWQIPWGKHRMPFVRLSHKANGLENYDQTKFLPVVMIRDPFNWMQSMCKMPYAAHWKHSKQHCPNLVPDDHDYKRFGKNELSFRNGTASVKVIFSEVQIFFWNSLVDLYSDYYRQYLDADYPRLIVRFEDMLLQPKTVLSQVAECLGVSVADQWRYQTGSSKGHGSHTTFVSAIAKTGDAAKRVHGLTIQDLEYAERYLDEELMQTFHYKIPKREDLVPVV